MLFPFPQKHERKKKISKKYKKKKYCKNNKRFFLIYFNWESRIWTLCWAMARSFSNSINLAWSSASLNRYRAQFWPSASLNAGRVDINAWLNVGLLIHNRWKLAIKTLFIIPVRFNHWLFISWHYFTGSASIGPWLDRRYLKLKNVFFASKTRFIYLKPRKIKK